MSDDSASGGENGSSKRRQQDQVDVLLTDQLVVNEFARGSNPEHKPLHPCSEEHEVHDDVVESNVTVCGAP